MMSWTRIFFATAAALLAAELLLRVTESSRSNFIGAFHPTAYTDDPSLGPIFGRPNYRGVLNIPSERELIWTALDDKGLRPVPASSPNGPGILVMGGASQTFGFGVADADTWPAQMTKHLGRDVNTRVLSLPGVSLEREWLSFKAGRSGMHEPSVIVLSLYRWGWEIPTDDDAAQSHDYKLVDGRLEQMTPDEYSIYRVSRLAFGLWRGASSIPRALYYSHGADLIRRAYARAHTPVKEPPPDNQQSPSDTVATEAEKLKSFVVRLGSSTQPGGRIIVVALPSEGLPPDHFQKRMAGFPEFSHDAGLTPSTLRTNYTGGPNKGRPLPREPVQ